MESVKEFLVFLQEHKLNISLVEMMTFVMLNSFFMFYGKHKVGLLVSYAFTLYWAFISHASVFIEMYADRPTMIYGFVGAGVLTLILAIVGIFVGDND